MDLTRVIGLGVAGNFAGHLEQAGEAESFKDVKTADARAPKAVFPFYLPAPGGRMADSFLKVFPLTSEEIRIPGDEPDACLQTEPEVGILARIQYNGDHKVTGLMPEYFGAYNDCSIRRPGPVKISTKKNWGPGTKGLSANLIRIDSFSSAGNIAGYRIASFLKRDGVIHEYGIDSAVNDYSYMYGELLSWISERMNNQQDEGPRENISEYLALSNWPEYAVISIGATRYTSFGEKGYLKEGDVSYVVLYPSGMSRSEIMGLLRSDSAKDWERFKSISLLRQEVRRG